MTVKINADTSDGLKIVSDTSGVIDLQSNGSTKVSFDTSGNMTTSGTIPSSALTGALPAIDGSALTGLGGGITQADIWRLTTNVTGDTGGVSAFERADDSMTGKIGDGISFSTPYFSFPSTGIYLIQSQVMFAPTNDGDNVIWSTVAYDGSSTDTLAQAQGSDGNTSSFSQCFYDVTNTTNNKIYFSVASLQSGGNITGDTNTNVTSVCFIRLGDT